MMTRHKAIRLVVTLVVAGWLVTPGLAATPDELLDEALKQFREGKYERAQETLLGVETDKLTEERQRQREELAEEVAAAVNQSNKAAQDLEDAAKAFESRKVATAEERYQAVVRNAYATAAQKKRAGEGLALIKEQRELEGALAAHAPSTRPANTSATTRPADNLTEARRARAVAKAKESITAGNAAMKEAKYDLAQRHYEQALKNDPQSKAALLGLELVEERRGAEGHPGNLMETAIARRRIRWERVVTLYEGNERETRRLINEDKYDEARLRVEDSKHLLDSARYDAYPPEAYGVLKRNIEALGRFIDKDEEDHRKRMEDRARTKSIDAENARKGLILAAQRQRVDQLFAQSQQLAREQQYEKAAEILEEIIALDPTYERAKWRIQDLQDAHLIKKDRDNREEFLRSTREALLEANMAKTPKVTGANDKIMAFPPEEDWRIIANRDPFGAEGIGAESDADRLTRKRLEATIPELDFPEGSTFGEVIEALGENTDVAISVNWNALNMMAIDRELDTLGITFKNVTLETALEMLLDNIGGASGVELAYDVLEGLVIVSTTEDLNRKTETRVYDVRDLLLEIKSISGGGGMGMMGGMGMGGMGMGMFNVPPEKVGKFNGPPEKAGLVNGRPKEAGMFNVAPEKVGKFKVTTVCLEHGKPEPRPAMKYEIKPIASFTDKAEVHELCRMLGSGRLDQRAAQVAAWHLNNKMSFQELAAKRLRFANGNSRPYFAPQELRAGMQLSVMATRLAEQRRKSPGENQSAGLD